MDCFKPDPDLEKYSGRSLLELYKILLEKKIESPLYLGICDIINQMRDYQVISKREYNLLITDFEKQKPESVKSGSYWYHSHEERVEVINKRIELLTRITKT